MQFFWFKKRKRELQAFTDQKAWEHPKSLNKLVKNTETRIVKDKALILLSLF